MTDSRSSRGSVPCKEVILDVLPIQGLFLTLRRESRVCTTHASGVIVRPTSEQTRLLIRFHEDQKVRELPW